MLALDHIALAHGERTLFSDVSFVIGPHDRIGLVGSNGAGKSTLLRIINDEIAPDSGTVSKAGYVTVGYLPQDGVIASGSTLIGEVERSFESLVEVRDELESVYRQLGTTPTDAPEYQELIEISGELQHKLEDLDAFRMQSNIEKVLMGLGFQVRDFGRRTEEFSGGWQMRIALAKLLLREPSVLLLDEPTNHLDLDSLRWLEDYLVHYNGAVVLVSHDRALLDTLTRRTLAVGHGRIESYSGNYSFYVGESDTRRQLLMKAKTNQDREIRHTQDFIDRFRYKATKARQVQSRITMLEKIERIEIEDEEKEIRFHFPPAPPSGVKVMELRALSKKYGDSTIFNRVDFTVERGDRIAVVGVNGAGKSTLSRIMAGVEPFDGGERIVGHNAAISYFAQHQAEELDHRKEVLEILDDVAVGAVRTKLRTILGAFLFQGDDAFKKVSVLSGGEKSRLALAKMLLSPANFLIMDEPTNHLDMRSKHILQEALREYEGSFLIVSHDRAFLDPLVNKVIVPSPEKIFVNLGNVTDYLERKAALSGKPETAHRQAPAADRKRLEAEQRQELARRLKPLKQELSVIEQEIASKEKRKTELEALMADPDIYKNGDEAKKITSEFRSVKQELERAYAYWEDVSGKIESIAGAQT